MEPCLWCSFKKPIQGKRIRGGNAVEAKVQTLKEKPERHCSQQQKGSVDRVLGLGCKLQVQICVQT